MRGHSERPTAQPAGPARSASALAVLRPSQQVRGVSPYGEAKARIHVNGAEGG